MHLLSKIYCNRGLCVFLLALICAQVNAQSLGLETSLALGKLALHSPDLTERSERPLIYFEISLVKEGNGHRYWEEYHRMPKIGLNLRYNTYGLPSVYGNAISLFPSVQWSWMTHPLQSLDVRLGSGIAYATRPFNRVTNPLNKGLSNQWNNITNLQLRYTIDMANQQEVFLGVDLSHHSNASISKPNRGLNQFYMALGWQKKMGEQREHSKNTTLDALNPRKWGVSYAFGKGRRENYENSGPTFSVLHHTMEFNYRRNPVSSLTLGIDYEWHEFEEFFKLSTQYDQESDKLRKNNDRWGINMGYEVGFGHLAIHIMMGVNLGQKDNPFVRTLLYNRLKAKWYFLDPVKNPGTIYALVSMKSHAATAEYLSLGIGAAAFAFPSSRKY